MLDDDARRALEEEAIALVNLSHSHPPPTKRRRRPPPMTSTAPTPMATSATATIAIEGPHASMGIDVAATAVSADTPDCRLSMSLFVNADGKMRAISRGGKTSPDHHAALEITAIEHAHDDSDRPHDGPKTARSPDPSGMSMQSLVVNLKKRKLPQDGTEPSPARKLPSFRDIFNTAQRPQPQSPSPSPSPATSPPRARQAMVAIQPAADRRHQPQSPGAPNTNSAPLAEPMSPTTPPPPELKCKYRTGKCNQIRALKSCGDYHNLCNYHRLRANANQRKLDRKKKVQRQQQGGGQPSVLPATTPASALTSADATTRALPLGALMPPSAAAAAAALASLPTAFLASQALPVVAGPPIMSYLARHGAAPRSAVTTASASPPYTGQSAPPRPREGDPCQ